jgi:hypothetical protein
LWPAAYSDDGSDCKQSSGQSASPGKACKPRANYLKPKAIEKWRQAFVQAVVHAFRRRFMTF